MTETGIVALAGVFATLVSGLGASWLTNWNATQRDAAQARRETQAAARELIVKTLIEARLWLTSAAGPSMVIAGADRLEIVDNYLKNDFADSESGRLNAEHGSALRESLTSARLLIADKPLTDALEALQRLHDQWWALVIAKMREDLKAKAPDKVARMLVWTSYSDAFTKSVTVVEAAARERISVSLTP